MRTVLLFCLLSSPSFADTQFWLKNTDPTALFNYWTTDRANLAETALAAGGRHAVAPGERVLVRLPGKTLLLGVFVPWKDPLTLRTPLEGGSILPAEAPPQGTLLVSRETFRAANQGRAVTGTLPEWGLEVPRFVLGGGTGWTGVAPLLEWGPVFRPPEGWPPGPRPKTLQAADREGAFWLKVTLESTPFPGGPASLLLRREGAALEWPLTGSSTVWLWDAAGQAAAVGTVVRGEGTLEAFIPWDRLPAGSKEAWSQAGSVWQWAGASVATLGGFRWEDLP